MIRHIRPTRVTEPDFTVIQGAYTLCCAVLNGESKKTQEGNTEWNCVADWPPDFTSSGSWGSIFELPPQPITNSKGEDWLKFQSLVKQWRIERGSRSSITETVIMPSYQNIIGMGETAVPLLLAQLASEGDDPDQWFWALMAITGQNPVKTEDQGDFQKMARAWLQWAEREINAW